MVQPAVTQPSLAVDEAALRDLIVTRLLAVGWSAWGATGPAGTTPGAVTPADTIWVVSPGESGRRHIVIGIRADTVTRQMQLLPAADIDTLGLIGAVGGYTNDDNTATLPTSAPGQGGTEVGAFDPRDPATTYTVYINATLDAFSAEFTYISNAQTAQGLIHGGQPDAVSGREFYKYGRSRIDTITLTSGVAGSGAIYRVRLKDNINRALKDGTVYTTDVHPTSALLHQAVVANEPGEGADFSMVERIPIVAGSLTTFGTPPNDVTEYKIDTSVGVKLAAVGGRYDQAVPRGQFFINNVGDVVSVMAEPTLVCCQAKHDGGGYIVTTSGTVFCVAAWYMIGGQRDNSSFDKRLFVTLSHKGNDVSDRSIPANANNANDPGVLTNRGLLYEVYAVGVKDVDRPDKLPTPDDDDHGNFGQLRDFACFPSVVSAPDLAVGTVNGKLTQRYRIQEYISGLGLGTPSSSFGKPSFGARHYIMGLRGDW